MRNLVICLHKEIMITSFCVLSLTIIHAYTYVIPAITAWYTVQLPNTDTSQNRQLPKTDHIFEERNESLYI